MALFFTTRSMCHGLPGDKGVHVPLHKGSVSSQLSQDRICTQKRWTSNSVCAEPASSFNFDNFGAIRAQAFIGPGKNRRRPGMICEWRIKRANYTPSASNSANLIQQAVDRLLGRPVKFNFRGAGSIPRSRWFQQYALDRLGSMKELASANRRCGSGGIRNVMFEQLRSGCRAHLRSSKRSNLPSLRRTPLWHGSRTKKVGLQNWRYACEASKKGSNNPQPTPPEEESESKKEGTSGDLTRSSFPRPSLVPETDWRLVRARLVAGEQASIINSTGSEVGDGQPAAELLPSSGSRSFYPALSKRWAHPILSPEAGAVLIASEKLDGMPNFERSVVLLLNGGPGWTKIGPYGLILNQPLPRRIKHVKPKDQALIRTFGACQVHVGGPLDTNKFLLLHATAGVKNFREVIPGVYYGSPEGLEPAAEMMRTKNALPQDLRFFFGYSGWGTDQLKKEISLGMWHVAACSTDLITGVSNAGLWEEILVLMGGKYAELSKRPRRKM